MTKICTGGIFRQITTFIKLIDFTKIIFQLKGLKPKNKGHSNFYECCDLTKKVYLKYIYGENNCFSITRFPAKNAFRIGISDFRKLLQKTIWLTKFK